MTHSCLVSVIVPVYNVSTHLTRCIDSLISQTLTDIEIVLVDDGSTDGSTAVCQAYADSNPRIIFLRQNNQGVSSARNSGLSRARGKYVGFVDSDDLVHPAMFSSLVEIMATHAADIAICGFAHDDCSVFDCLPPTRSDAVVTSGVDLLHEVFVTPPTILSSVCNKLFRRELIGSLSFNTDLSYEEDGLFLVDYLLRVVHGAYLSSPLYLYTMRPDSATHTFSRKNLQRVDAIEKMLALVPDQASHLKDLVIIRLVNVALTLARQNATASLPDREIDMYLQVKAREYFARLMVSPHASLPLKTSCASLALSPSVLRYVRRLLSLFRQRTTG